VDFYLKKYIEGKAGPDEKFSWAQTVIKKGFTGEIKLISSPINCLREGFIKLIAKIYSSIVNVNYAIYLFKLKQLTLIYLYIACDS
jgi:hypothetical protein